MTLYYEDVKFIENDKRPLIFLDIDGVINSLEFIGPGLPLNHQWYQKKDNSSYGIIAESDFSLKLDKPYTDSKNWQKIDQPCNDILSNVYIPSPLSSDKYYVFKDRCYTIMLPLYMPSLIQSLVKNNEVWFLSMWGKHSNGDLIRALGIDPLPCISITDDYFYRKCNTVEKYGDIALKQSREVYWIEDHSGDIVRSLGTNDIKEQRKLIQSKHKYPLYYSDSDILPDQIQLIDTCLLPLILMDKTDNQARAVLKPEMLPSHLIPDYKI